MSATTWIAKIQYQGKQPFWLGTFKAEGRENAKRACRMGVSAFLGGEDYTLLAIARGSIEVKIEGEEIAVNP